MVIPAIVLAAGKSRRMGSPKALLRSGGTTLLEDALARIRAVPRLHGSIVVLGHHRDAILEAVPLEAWVYNARYEDGMTTSFQAGIRRLPDAAEGAMLFLVDHPAPEAATIGALLDAFVPGRIVLPVFEGRRGHPVLFGRDALGEIAALPAGRGAHTVVRSRPGRVVEAPVDDPAVVADIDTPEDWDRWKRVSGGGA